MPETCGPTDRTRVTRAPHRGRYDRATVDAILDAGFICHLGFVKDGQPYVIPTIYARSGEQVYLHGSTASRMVRVLDSGLDVCLTVTLVDGLVLARSAFHHSVNYRSVVVIGAARMVRDEGEKTQALAAIVDHVVPGRWDDVRPPTSQEMKATAVLALPLAEASAKVRTGPPIDDADDLARPVWAGEIPLVTAPGRPLPDAHVTPDIAPFDVARLARRAQRRAP